jgi:hypothetical protein
VPLQAWAGTGAGAGADAELWCAVEPIWIAESMLKQQSSKNMKVGYKF